MFYFFSQAGIDSTPGRILTVRSGLCAMQRLVFCCALILVLAWAHPAQATDKFKPFKLKTIDGVTRTLEDFKGKATLVAFFFPTCSYCNKAFPETVKIYNKYKDQGLAMVWINIVREEEKQIPDWLAQHHYENVPVLVGASQRKLQRNYKIEMTPEHLIVNQDSEILFRQRGYHAGNEAELENQVKQALGLTGQPLAINYSP